MKKENDNKRKLKHQQLDQLLSFGISVHTDIIQTKNKIDSHYNTEKSNFRYSHKTQLEPASLQQIQEQPIIRQITVDLRPILGQVTDPCVADISDIAEVSQKVHKRRDVSTLQRNSGTINISLPSVSTCKSREDSSPPHPVQRGIGLVEVTDEGTLTSDPTQKFRDSSPMFFPKVILNHVHFQKTFKEEKPLNKINSSWLGVEKLQLPMSELVRVVKERTNSGHHTLIAQVLCSLREQEKQHHQGGLNVEVLGRRHAETSHEMSYIPCAIGGTRLKWMKRS